MRTSDRTRRAVLALSAGLLGGLAGCSAGPGGSTSTRTTTATTTDRTTSQTATTARTDTGTTTTTSDTKTETETETETDEDAPGYKHSHWHGRLFFEVDGELVDFDQPKYYLENIEADHPETVYFHFHKDVDAHGPNEWSNEKKVVTFQRALNLVPGIGYEQQSGEHVVTYEGTTYDARQSGTSITIKEDDDPIDPTSYEVADDDVYYVQIVTGDAKRNAKPAHGVDARGTLLLDLNNVRVDFSRERFLGPEAGSEAFHFHDDGAPSMWYKEGSVTLADALNSLPGITYERRSGSHVLTYEDEERPAYSRTYDASSAGDEIVVRQRTTPIDPTSYEPAAGDVLWVYVQSDSLPSNEH